MLPEVLGISTGNEIHSGEKLSSTIFFGNFSHHSIALALSLLIVFAILTEKFGIKLGLPGSIFLFFSGLLFPGEKLDFESLPIEEVHIYAVSIMLFFSGLSFKKSILKRNKILLDSFALAIFGTLLSMLAWFIYFRVGFSSLKAYFGYLEGVEPQLITLITVIVVASIAVQDWNAFTFVAQKAKGLGDVITNVVKIETAISASISIAIAELAILFWLEHNPGFNPSDGNTIGISIFQGILLGLIVGITLGYILMLLIRYFVGSHSQLVLAVLSFIIIGYSITYSTVRQGGYLCVLIMGIVTSLSYRSASNEEEVQFLIEALESVNIAAEAVLFFAIGLGLNTNAFFYHLPVAIYVWTGVLFIRPVLINLFFREKTLQPPERALLSFFSPKGAISMALVVTAPEILEHTFHLDISTILPESSYTFMTDVICGAVVLSMIFKSYMIPYLHSRLYYNIIINSKEQA